MNPVELQTNRIGRQGLQYGRGLTIEDMAYLFGSVYMTMGLILTSCTLPNSKIVSYLVQWHHASFARDEEEEEEEEGKEEEAYLPVLGISCISKCSSPGSTERKLFMDEIF
ncbi:hypothetical protein EGR_09136 [Echinococcus granulosus]|uniref:Uncharacterized protein n=1 Tax=Echinococcus granulosus TaxID=6210 RepID=W6U6N9_ECHGR|nr:hypothetical protein EGR_09136 [Echinococcus granulosus]EUB56011.1 hypothetical protein EGR_09136 [Echinococcus granulosus]